MIIIYNLSAFLFIFQTKYFPSVRSLLVFYAALKFKTLHIKNSFGIEKCLIDWLHFRMAITEIGVSWTWPILGIIGYAK
jgi:hypothetical protein